jgi:hypothetical protein
MPLFFSKDANNKCICPICLDDFSGLTHMAHSVCGHVFHYTCLMKWMRARPDNSHLSCPICNDTMSALFSYEHHEATIDKKTKIIMGLTLAGLLTLAFTLGVLTVVVSLVSTSCL